MRTTPRSNKPVRAIYMIALFFMVTAPVVSDTQIIASVPCGAMTGRMTVTTPAGAAYSASGTPFAVLSTATPTITSFTAQHGPTGTPVTLTGTHLTGTTGIT